MITIRARFNLMDGYRCRWISFLLFFPLYSIRINFIFLLSILVRAAKIEIDDRANFSFIGEGDDMVLLVLLITCVVDLYRTE